MVQSTPPKDRRYWSERDFLEKVSSYTRIHFEGKYKDVYSVPTASQRFVFDFFHLPYSFKGHAYNENKELPAPSADEGQMTDTNSGDAGSD